MVTETLIFRTLKLFRLSNPAHAIPFSIAHIRTFDYTDSKSPPRDCWSSRSEPPSDRHDPYGDHSVTLLFTGEAMPTGGCSRCFSGEIVGAKPLAVRQSTFHSLQLARRPYKAQWFAFRAWPELATFRRVYDGNLRDLAQTNMVPYLRKIPRHAQLVAGPYCQFESEKSR